MNTELKICVICESLILFALNLQFFIPTIKLIAFENFLFNLYKTYKNMKKLIFLSISIGMLSAFGCTKEKFDGTHSFWYNAETSDDLLAYGVAELTLFVDGAEIATIDAYDHYAADPGCGTGNFVYTDKMFKRENKTHSYRIVDEADSLIFEGTFQMKQKESCSSTKLDLTF